MTANAKGTASVNRSAGTSMALAMVLSLLIALLVWNPGAGRAYAATASPAGDVLSIGDPAAPGQIELYLDPLCPDSGRMIRELGIEIGRRIETGRLRINLRFVDFLEKYSASGTYDSRAIYASYVVADQSQSSDITWRFIEQIFSAERQPKEQGQTDLSNDQLAGIAEDVGAPPSARETITLGLPTSYDALTTAANNLALLRALPDPGVPKVVIQGESIDGNSGWLGRLPR